MNKLVTALFDNAFDALATVVTILLRPHIAGLGLNFAALGIVFGHVAAIITAPATPRIYEPVGQYTPGDVESLAHALAHILSTALDAMGLSGILTDAQAARLLSAVAARLA